MKKIVKVLWIVLPVLTLAGCKSGDAKELAATVDTTETTVIASQSAGDGDHVVEIDIETGSFKDQISYYQQICDNLETESYDYFDHSTQGGEITRFKDSDGNSFRYKINLYGEMGQVEYNYYFFDEDIYYAELGQDYTRSIYDQDIDVWNYTLELGKIAAGQYYRYDESTGDFVASKADNIWLMSREELDQEFARVREAETSTFSEYNIIAANGFLLGGYYDNQWLDCDSLYSVIDETENYKIYVNGQYQSTVQGLKYRNTEIQFDIGPQVKFDESEYDFDWLNPMIAFSGQRDLVIDRGVRLPVNHEIYSKTFQEYLVSNEIQGDYEIMELYKFDIDNDGQDEIFLMARYEVQPSDLSRSIGYMRKSIDDEIKEIPLPELDNVSDSLSVSGFCDLNGDGIKELICSQIGYSFNGYVAFEYRDGAFVRIFGSGLSHEQKGQ